MRRTVLTIFFVLAFAFISCSADEVIEVEKIGLKDRLSNAFDTIGDKVNSVLHRDQPEEVVEVVEQDRTIKGRLQDGIAQGREKFAEGRERLNENINKGKEAIKGKFSSQPEEAPVVEEEPTVQQKIQSIVDNMSNGIHSLGDKAKLLFSKEAEPVEEPETEETRRGLKDRLQQGFESASGKVKGVFNRESEAEPVQEEPAQEELGLKDRIVNKVLEVLHMEDRTLPPKVGDAVGAARETLEHGKAAVHEGVEAAKSESMTDRARHAYEAVKEGMKGFGTAKDAVVDTNQVPVEGGKDTLKETMKVALSKDNIKGKFDEAKDFMKSEAKDSIRMVKEKLGRGEAAEPEPVQEPEQSFAEKFIDALYSATNRLTEAVGIKKKDEKSSDL